MVVKRWKMPLQNHSKIHFPIIKLVNIQLIDRPSSLTSIKEKHFSLHYLILFPFINYCRKDSNPFHAY